MTDDRMILTDAQRAGLDEIAAEIGPTVTWNVDSRCVTFTRPFPAPDGSDKPWDAYFALVPASFETVVDPGCRADIVAVIRRGLDRVEADPEAHRLGIATT